MKTYINRVRSLGQDTSLKN